MAAHTPSGPRGDTSGTEQPCPPMRCNVQQEDPKFACKLKACAIQDCLARNDYDQRKCAKAIQVRGGVLSAARAKDGSSDTIITVSHCSSNCADSGLGVATSGGVGSGRGGCSMSHTSFRTFTLGQSGPIHTRTALSSSNTGAGGVLQVPEHAVGALLRLWAVTAAQHSAP